MKNIFVLFIALFSLTLFNSCRDDGDEWKENGQFAFTIERDNNFIEKAVGEVNSFKFNVNPTYNYSILCVLPNWTIEPFYSVSLLYFNYYMVKFNDKHGSEPGLVYIDSNNTPIT